MYEKVASSKYKMPVVETKVFFGYKFYLMLSCPEKTIHLFYNFYLLQNLFF
jgi:hypothetical protein